MLYVFLIPDMSLAEYMIINYQCGCDNGFYTIIPKIKPAMVDITTTSPT